jgi:hypothetical protein
VDLRRLLAGHVRRLTPLVFRGPFRRHPRMHDQGQGHDRRPHGYHHGGRDRHHPPSARLLTISPRHVALSHQCRGAATILLPICAIKAVARAAADMDAIDRWIAVGVERGKAIGAGRTARRL